MDIFLFKPDYEMPLKAFGCSIQSKCKGLANGISNYNISNTCKGKLE